MKKTLMQTREMYGVSRAKLAQMVGLSADRIVEMEVAQHDRVDRGTPVESMKLTGDASKVEEMLAAIKKQHDSSLAWHVSRLIAAGFDIAVYDETDGALAEISFPDPKGNCVTVTSRAAGRLLAIEGAHSTLGAFHDRLLSAVPYLSETQSSDVTATVAAIMDTLDPLPSNCDIGKAIEGAILAERLRHAA